jgi:outer membrane lipoprotein-sorting protein
MKNRICCLVAVTLLLWTAPPAARAAGFTNADEVLNFAADKYTSYQSYSTHFTQMVNAFGPPIKADGDIWFKRPALLRIQVAAPVLGQSKQMTAVMGADDVEWQEMVVGNQTNVLKVDFRQIPTNNPLSALIHNPLDGIDPKHQLDEARRRYDLELLPLGEWQGQPMYVLEGALKTNVHLNAKEASFMRQMGKQKVYIGREDGMIHHLDQYARSGTNVVVAMDFTNIKLNPTLADSLFTYQPPANVTVVEAARQLEQMISHSQSTTGPVLRLPPAGN